MCLLQAYFFIHFAFAVPLGEQQVRISFHSRKFALQHHRVHAQIRGATQPCRALALMTQIFVCVMSKHHVIVLTLSYVPLTNGMPVLEKRNNTSTPM